MKANRTNTISEQLSKAVAEGKTVLTLGESRSILEQSGIPFNRSALAKSPSEAVKLAKKIGYPLVMKIVSPQVIHKTEVGGVKVNIKSDEELIKAYDEIIAGTKAKVPDAQIDGILLEEMVKGSELIIGTTIDPQFGHMIMFGIGGIFVEVYKDVSFRLIPITSGDANDMLNELKGKAILKGVRGLPGAKPEQLVDILLKISGFVDQNKDVKEMDLNPLIITERGVVAVDARIILQGQTDVKDKVKSMKGHLEKLQ